MAKKSLILLIICLFIIWVAGASATGIKSRLPIQGSKIAKITRAIPLTGDEIINQGEYHPTLPGLITDSPGEIVGWSQIDYQTNGSSGNRIAVDSQGNIHVDWMHGRNGVVSSARSIDYNYRDAGGWEWPGGANPVGGIEASIARTSGYGQLSLTVGDSAVLAYHRASIANFESTYVSIDGYEGLGSFAHHGFRNWVGTDHCIWPYVTVDRSNRIHVVGTAVKPTGITHGQMAYTRSTDLGATWSTRQVIDTTGTTSVITTSSPVSNKVAIVYTRSFAVAPYDTINNGNGQWFDDVYYVQSTDGVTWDFAHGKHNITDYYHDNDSLAAYTDCDAVYDYNDNLHIIWSALPQTDSGVYYMTYLEHYSTGTGIINHICRSDSTWPHSTCGSDSSFFGVWNWSIAKMSIGSDPQNNLFATFTSWYSTDIAADGCANGEIFMCYSNDNGATWTLKGDLTNSHTPDCAAGDCDSDHWSSLAEKVDDNLHIIYVNDKDAGGIPQSEGSVTDNPMRYIAYPNPVRAHAIPLAPTLIFPGNAYSDTFNAFQFEWTEPVGVLHYEIQIDDNQDFSSPIFTDNNVLSYQWINPDTFPVGTYYWHVKSAGYYGDSPWSDSWSFTVRHASVGCAYVPGDINGNGSVNGVDIVFAVNYFKGGPNHPPIDCFPACPNEPNPFFAAGDVNGNCAFNGIDITYFVRFLKLQVPSLLYCADCPPAP